eukprot:c16483_g1_i1.p1 GENE.c16483_g1_i1~~c16483_g1_i1.p1  ORF type:complete len:306 (+),score=148.65 c16483_g1_i1:24-920(+)
MTEENIENKVVKITTKRKIGIVGYGSLGKFLYEKINLSDDMEISFVWNRTYSIFDEEEKEKPSSTKKVPENIRLKNLSDFKSFNSDLIIEVAHPSITAEYGTQFIEYCDYFVGSPTAFSELKVEEAMRKKAEETGHSVYIPSGAFWGANDVQKMSKIGLLKSLTVQMAFHTDSLKLVGELEPKLEKAKKEGGRHIIYQGSVRPLCLLAPNNVNTMAVASIAAENLGFDGVQAVLIADDTLTSHNIDIEVQGVGEPGLNVLTHRVNPAKAKAVTGSATFHSFYASLLFAKNRGKGFHIC